MKNLARKIFTAAVAAVILTSSVATTLAAEPALTQVTPRSAQSFNRIWVSGNVKIVLTQGDKQSVIGTENYNSSKTSVVTNGKTLYIHSAEPEQVTLTITMKDLERVEAYGGSMVVTSNKFNVKYLQLFLSHTAYAKIKTTAKSLYTVVKDDAILKLDGTADQSTMVASNTKNIKLRNFSSLKLDSYASEAIMKADPAAMTASN
jgi:hypothetical protein